MKILLVEDDLTISETLSFILTQEGYEVSSSSSVAEASQKIENQAYDLYIFDIGLPDGSGFSLCKKVQDKQKPVLVLSAYDEESHVVLGLDLGADDYIVKPFRTKELLSRIRSVIRRYEGVSKVMVLDQIEMDIERAKVYKNRKELFLSVTEYKLLLILVKYNHKTLSRSQLIHLLWEESGEYISDNALSVNVKRLREKIEDNPNQPQWIKTIRGLGYSIDL